MAAAKKKKVTRKKKATARKQVAKGRAPKVKAAKRPAFFFPLLGRLIIAGLFCVGITFIYLDKQISQRFRDGVHPQPAHLFARSHQIRIDSGPDQKQLIRTLDYLGYRSVKKIAGPGTYVAVQSCERAA